MSYNMKLENFLDLQIYKQHQSQKTAALLHCAVLSNKLQCHNKCHIKLTQQQTARDRKFV